jgi:hypothetical protein
MDFSGLRRLGQYLLGAFVCWQLLFVIVFNYLQVVLMPIELHALAQADEKPGAIEHAALAVQEVDYRWAELTGQYQCWWLFALPLRESTFPLVELRWDDPNRAPVQLHAFQEPTDPASFFRPPDVRDRRFHYDANVCLSYSPWHAELQARARAWWPGPWFDYVRYVDAQMKRARGRWPSILAYMEWRVRLWRSEHPDEAPPQEVRFYQRAYPTPAHDAGWIRPAPEDRPIARWRPGQEAAAGLAPLEVYDPRQEAYVPLPLEETP